MIFFVNTISNPSIFILANEGREIIAQQQYEIKGNESSLFIEKIDDFFTTHGISYDDIKNIIVVHGPGSFTGIRTIVLTINTIAYMKNIFLTPLSYFDLFTNYPIITPSSKRDSFIQFTPNSDVQIVKNIDIPVEFSTFYGNQILENREIIENINYSDIIQHIELQTHTRITPLYIKKPNIS